jgi:hypothetical protein
VYPKDLGDNKKLASLVGHVEHDEINFVRFLPDDPFLVKTHELSSDDKPAIYVIRDGRPACVSLWKFYHKTKPLAYIVNGQHRFKTWADHVKSWDPKNRPNTLLLRYEDMVNERNQVIDCIAEFLNREVLSYELPMREQVADIDGRHVNKYSDWREILTGADLELFWERNGEVMEKMYGIGT